MNEFLDLASEYVDELKAHFDGDKQLSVDELEAYKGIVKAACRSSFYFFTKAILGFDKLVQNPHKKWCDDLQENFNKNDYFLYLKPRETFKTTIYGESFMLWVWACISPQIRIFYTSANQILLDEIAVHLDHFIGHESRSLYYSVFGIKRDPSAPKNTQDTFNLMGRDITAKGSTLMLRTAGGSINGVHPHIIIVDDPCDKEDRESLAVRKKKKGWFDTLIPLLTEFEVPVNKRSQTTEPPLNTGSQNVNVRSVIQKVFIIGTRWHYDDLLNHVMEKDKECQIQSEKFRIEIESVYDKDGNAAYGDFYPIEKVNKKKTKISSVFFACQYLNNPLPEELQIFEIQKLFFRNMAGFSPTLGLNYCFFDPSQGKQKSDFPAVVWFNVYEGKTTIFDAIDKKIPLALLLPLIATKNKVNKTIEMVFEDNGSSLIQKTLEDEHKKLFYSIKIKNITHSRNKHERIISSQPYLYNGTVFFREDYKVYYPELMDQIINYPVYSHDDFPDVIELGISHLLSVDKETSFKFVKIGADGVMK